MRADCAGVGVAVTPRPTYTTTPTLPVTPRVSTLTVASHFARVLTRLQQLANVAAVGDAPALAMVDLRTWEVTLITTEDEQDRHIALNGKTG